MARIVRSRGIRIAVVAAAVLVLAGCGRFAGGGSVKSTVSGKTAQFSFNLDCRQNASGVLTFIDRAALVQIRATPTSCHQLSTNSATFSGTYVTIPPLAPGSGTFTLTVTAATPQVPKSATYSIKLTGTGIPGGSYTNSGPVDGTIAQIS